MKRTITILFISMACISILKGQVDPVAKSILDKFSSKALGADAITLKFDMQVLDAVEDSETNESGEIVISKDRYKLQLPGNIVWFDGTATYTLVPDVEELTITEPDPDPESFLSRPSLLFTMYSQGYKVKMLADESDGTIIDLYPEDLSTELSRVRLNIGKDYSLKGAEYKRKDGISIFISVKVYDLSKSYKDTFFSFDQKKYRNVDIIDMRF
ncbi:MAG: hypothetical protein V2I37_08525 [Marinilabiliaceae bacterium]|jgi:hypothetical protein|nr:hypothetical protein [Marinilabiliaceae bacterium]